MGVAVCGLMRCIRIFQGVFLKIVIISSIGENLKIALKSIFKKEYVTAKVSLRVS